MERNITVSIFMDDFFQLIVNEIDDGLLLVDVETKLIIYVNKACEELYGYKKEELAGKSVSMIQLAGEGLIQKEIQNIISHYPDWYQYENNHVMKNGCSVPVKVIAKMVIINGRKYVLNQINNLSNQKRQEEKVQNSIMRLQYQAYHDHLTGMYNRTYLFEVCLKRILGCSIGIVLLDIDHFKTINDQYGHQAGDVILQNVTHRILPLVRHHDKAVRYGGDELLILLPNILQADLFKLAQRIKSSIACAEFVVKEQLIVYSVSVGVAYGTVGDETQIEQLIKEADEDLYKEKRQRSVVNF